MKTWNAPVLEEMKLSETQYGGKNTVEFDDIYVNAEGKYEGTFIAS